jgi:hypothetical protein
MRNRLYLLQQHACRRALGTLRRRLGASQLQPGAARLRPGAWLRPGARPRLGAARRGLGAAGQRFRDRGAATAEYAVATLAACGFAGLLLVILRSDEVRGLLLGIIRRALSAG